MNEFSHYPYQNFSDYNLDWILKLVKEVNKKLSEYLERSIITFADPITWDITEQYTALTCVIDSDGTAYLSKQPVPAGIAITDTDYWLPIFNYDDNINALRDNIGSNERNSATATANRHVNDLVWLKDTLYRVTTDIAAGAAYVVGSNCEKCTVSDALQLLILNLTTVDKNLKNDIAAVDENLKNNIAINEDSTTASAARKINDLVFLNGTLYRITADMTAGTAYVVGTNCTPCTVSEMIQLVIDMLQAYADEHYYYVIEGDTAAKINAELAANAGTLIIFKHNTYNIEIPIEVPANSRIDLNGATLKRTNGIHNIVNISANNVRIENGKLDGQCWADSLDNRIAGNRFSNLYAHDCNGLLLQNIYSTGNCSGEYQEEGSTAPLLIENVTDAEIIDCETYRDGGSGLMIDQSTNVIVTGYRSEYNAGSGITGSYNKNITVSDSIVRYAGTTYPNYFVSNYTGISLNGEDITCSNCISEGNSGSGYTLGHSVTHTRITLTGCIGKDNALDGVTIGAERVNISNCEFIDNTRYAIGSINTEVRYIIVDNCIMNASGTAAFSIDVNQRVQLNNCMIAGKHINVTGIAQISNCTFVEQVGTLASIIISSGGTCYSLLNKFSLNGGNCPNCFFVQGTGYSMFDINIDIPAFSHITSGGIFKKTDLPS